MVKSSQKRDPKQPGFIGRGVRAVFRIVFGFFWRLTAVVALIVLRAPVRAMLVLALILPGIGGLAPIVIGDAFQPRALMHAVAEGRRALQTALAIREEIARPG